MTKPTCHCAYLRDALSAGFSPSQQAAGCITPQTSDSPVLLPPQPCSSTTLPIKTVIHSAHHQINTNAAGHYMSVLPQAALPTISPLAHCSKQQDAPPHKLQTARYLLPQQPSSKRHPVHRDCEPNSTSSRTWQDAARPSSLARSQEAECLSYHARGKT
jgi:hypothetical protein